MKFSQSDFENKFYSFGKNDNYEVVGKYTKMLEKIEIKHLTCGNTFTRLASKTTPKVNCPRCHKQSRNKRTDKMFKEELKELVGNEYTPLEKYINTDTKTLLRHNTCGYEWSIAPNTFLNGGVRCPNCAKGGIKRDNNWFLEILEEIDDYEEEYLFLEEYKNYDTKISIRHSKCGEEYKVSPNKFIGGRRCPVCRESKGEKKISTILDILDIEYEREKKFEGMRHIYPLRCDFYISDKRYRQFVIEFDGRQHFESMSEKDEHKKNLEHIQMLDSIKDEYMKKNEIKMYRIPHWKIDNVNEIIKDILQENLQRLSKAQDNPDK